jgi:hypothetical protein
LVTKVENEFKPSTGKKAEEEKEGEVP